MSNRSFRRLIAILLFLVCAASAPAQVIISEFEASNGSGLKDEDGAYSDWIELFNGATTNVNLNGWYLTDSAGSLSKWRFPATIMPPNSFLVVFASGKNRTTLPLHANFSLSGSGEYLALVKPDGVTVVSEFAPTFPEQFSNISYGIGQDLQTTSFVSNSSPALVYFPSNGTLGTLWLTNGFDASTWLSVTNGIGYESYIAGFAVKNIRASGSVCDLNTADAVLVTPSSQATVFTENRNVINYFNSGGAGNFGGDFTFPGFSTSVDENNFVVEATAIITIPTAGQWTFGVNSDDGFRVNLGTNVFSFPAPRGSGDTLATFNLTPGEYPMRLVFYECGGGSEVEFFAAPGAFASYNASFRLVGDTANGGLAAKSLRVGGPTSASIRSLIVSDVQTQMLNKASSAYLRFPFQVTDASLYSSLTLRMKYNDGFVAYLNGVEIARRNSPASPQWNSVATTTRATVSATVFEDIDATPLLSSLQSGPNILAIHGLNSAANSSEFLILAQLVENKVLGLTNHYFATPTPGTFNSTEFFAFVDNLDFNPGRGWFANTNLFITITSSTPGITIRYTRDGSAPTTTSGILYTNGIAVTNTTNLRAIGYKQGFEPTDPETHSYIFLDQVQRQSTNVNYVGGSSGDYTLSPNITQGTLYKNTFQNDLLGIPTLSITAAWEDVFGVSGFWSNPNASGVAWERPCSVEYMRPDGKKGFDLNCGIRIQGGASRGLVSKHGMRLLFKTQYGPGKLAYDLYPNSPVEEFDTLTMHASFNDHWLWVGAPAQMQRDLWCRETQIAMGSTAPHGTYAHVYLNGLYWGIYNIGEKGDASFASHYLGGEKEEYDALNSDELVDGDANAWNAMFAIANAGITNDLAYTNLNQYLDIPDFIDYMLLNFYAANTDWPGHNWNAARRRVPGAGYRFFTWDAEWTLGIGADVNGNRTTVGVNDGSPGRLYANLRLHPEFLRQFGDHVQKHCFNGGVLTPASTDARWMKRAAELDRAIVGESARWGFGYDRQTWLTAQAAIRSYFAQRTPILLSQLRNAGLYPQLNAPAFGQNGGLVPPNYSLSITNPNASGSIYYTLNGSDPRIWGGGLSSSALLYSGPVTLTKATFIRARVLNGTQWSAIIESPFYIVQDFSSLAVTEIMYYPPNLGAINTDDLEFLELKNTGTNQIDLSGLAFTEGITFAFTNGTTLAPGQFFVLVRTPAGFSAKYPGVPYQGVYSGKLDNNGENLTLQHILGTNVFSFSYNNRPPWPITPDAWGFSLVRASLAMDPASASAWRPSTNPGGSPGADDPAPTIPPVLINEVLTHTTPPAQDAIELQNPTAQPVNVSGWFLTDEVSVPMKFRIPDGTTIAPFGFVTFYETNFNPQPDLFPSFALSALGESLYLFSGNANTNLNGYSYG
ncbi:MAG TPA: lamin tail domain-containing protein, partial [Candidatus Saccharimonadales bacterium]|nr:lamin tail domain-containing protein [Candidatus Saccharimonadales bacterium]